MKYGNICMGLWLGISAMACNVGETDKDYLPANEVMNIEITGLQDTTLHAAQEAKLEPVVKGMDDERNYTFTWCAYPAKPVAAKRDTLGHEKALVFTPKYPVGDKYEIVFEVKDKRTDVFACKKFVMQVTSEYLNGWYVLEDDGTGTDFDFIAPGGKVTEDILTKTGSGRLLGNAVKILSQAGSYSHLQENPDGTSTILNKLKVLHILSDKDMRTVDAGDFSVYKNFPDMFYEVPATCRPQYAEVLRNDYFLLNDGWLSSITGSNPNVGKNNAPRTGSGQLHPDVITGNNSTLLAFDEASHSFLWTSIYDSNMKEVTPTDPNKKLLVSPHGMNARLLHMMQRQKTNGWAILESIEGKHEHYLADIRFASGEYPFVDFDTINPDRKFLQADVFGAHHLNNFYFAKGNVLSYYQKNTSDSNSTEKNIWSFGRDETISYIHQMDAILVVLTNKADGWNLYRFQLIGEGVSPEIEKLIEPVWHGKGHARYVMYK